jgi:protein involved in polysaccharide export with SLBB domain
MIQPDSVRPIRLSNLTKAALPLLAFLIFLLAGCGGAGPSKELSSTANPPANYNLGFGDRVAVTVYGEKDLSGEYEVDDTGAVSMPLVGAVKIGDKTARDAEKAIAGQLTRGGIMTNPQVAVQVVRYRPVYIMGEVQKPGAYPYYSGITVLNAVALAGGYTYRANSGRINVVRPSDDKEPQRATETAYLAPGDIVIIPERWF